MEKQDLERTVIETATELKGIRAGVTDIKEGQGKLWKAVDALREDGGKTREDIAGLNWLPRAVLGIITAIIGRAIWIISGAGK